MVTENGLMLGPNFVPLPYRQVSVQPYSGALTADAISAHLQGRDAYRRTRFVVLHQNDACAIARVQRQDDEPLFSPITGVEILALPGQCVWVEDASVDPGNLSALAEAAWRSGVDVTGTLVVRGMDGHVNFIHRPQPLIVRVVDVVPPEPPKLLRMAYQVLGYADLPPIRLEADTIDLRVLAQQAPDADAFLVPCRASGLELGAPTYFLDEHPEKQPWTLLACERSCQIYRHFYGELDAPRIDFCPRRATPPDGTPTLTKCCLLEDRVEITGCHAVVPWGASLRHVLEALQAIVEFKR